MILDTYALGLDVGSTTVKVVVLDKDNNILFSRYERHHSNVREKALELLKEVRSFIGNANVTFSLSGSAGMGLADEASVPFIQEVFATNFACEALLDNPDVIIELGGEDAKILFLTGGQEERMNGSCAGGTGAFIDQMASLLSVNTEELDELSKKHTQIYDIASRCGVFAKSDIQPLINQGAKKEDLAASIYQAIVNQTIAGLAQGREIKGKIVFLGGPLTFQSGLRERFRVTLGLDDRTAILPENSLYFVAVGAALSSKESSSVGIDTLIRKFEKAQIPKNKLEGLPPLFNTAKDYESFIERHSKSDVSKADISTYTGDAYLGIDAGSTTTKMALIADDGSLLYSFYTTNKGEPVSIVKKILYEIFTLCGDRINICASSATGYGEELMKNAFNMDFGIVETTAHYFAARHFRSDVDFILDIGGQDMKCFKLKNGVVESILLNEACSSGCGSFIETFASALGKDIAAFAKEGIFARSPVDLGSRCTVFMNSSVKQAQKDGATVADISAGLAISVVKNVLYKVIRAKSPDDLGNHIVVQGGTFLNDCVLRAFEQEVGKEVLRPAISGLMGAYGAALYAKENAARAKGNISLKMLNEFEYSSHPSQCKGCSNHCRLIVNEFSGGRKFISGGRCEKALGLSVKSEIPNAYDFKLKKLLSYKSKPGPRGKIGIPFVLNMYENLPLWHTLLTELGFEVVLSGKSSTKLYMSGQHTIPSDTVCYPAKLVHGHIEALLDKGINRIFYPVMPHNFNEGLGDNHYNCPVVAYYPELIAANVTKLDHSSYYMPYFVPVVYKNFVSSIEDFFKKTFGIKRRETKAALEKAMAEYESYKQEIKKFGQDAIEYARKTGKHIFVLCGRPYHVDPEVNHGIDKLITSLGIVVLSEDSISDIGHYTPVNVLNQWAYHSRIYSAAKFVAKHNDMDLVQLVSFGCGLDAITSDETKSILEDNDKIYTQIKIDEINNLGAAKIRLRSLFEATANQGQKR